MSDLTDPGSALPAHRECHLDSDVVLTLGPVVYGLFVLSEPGPLEQLRTLADSQAAYVPAQTRRPLDHDARQEKLLGELGALDF